MRRTAVLLAGLMTLAGAAWALDPLPEVVQGPGYSTWTLEADLPMVKLEDAMAGLRSRDQFRHLEALKDLGFQREYRGRGEWAWPEFQEPIHAQTQFLSFERRKLAVLTVPVKGGQRCYAVILRQEGNGEAYWRARQVFSFATDPVEGLKESFPDVLGDDIRFWEVQHLVQDDIYGRAQVTSLFRYDERGRMRLTFQELSDAYLTAKFIGHSLRLQQTLRFAKNQKIVRSVRLSSYPWMRREEFLRYLGVRPNQAVPSKVWTLRESFAWDPADFDFYGARQELDKLLHNPSPFIRVAAAQRLGEHLKTVPKAMADAVWKDKSPLVRIQVALALAAIADPSALPAVRKALRNWNEDDTVREALERARTRLERAEADSGKAASPGVAAAR